VVSLVDADVLGVFREEAGGRARIVAALAMELVIVEMRVTVDKSK
jgi:hypothetical protein